MSALAFYKYHGTGNDFIVVDNRTGQANPEDYRLFARLCHRHFGIGADGVLLLETEANVVGGILMRYYNADGNPGSMCGNGGRCFVQFARKLGLAQPEAPFRFTASDGPHTAFFRGNDIALQMTSPGAVQELEPGIFFVDTGSPHIVVWRSHDTYEQNQWALGIHHLELNTLAPPFRYDKRFAPGGTNVNWVEPTEIMQRRLIIRTFERGVEAETLSCGTGAVAAAVVARHLDPAYWGNTLHLDPPGGALSVEFPSDSTPPWLIGPAVEVYSGTWQL